HAARVHGRSLPLAVRRSGDAPAGAARDRDVRGGPGRDGLKARRPAARGRPVPPRECAHTAGPAPPRQLPAPGGRGRGGAAGRRERHVRDVGHGRMSEAVRAALAAIVEGRSLSLDEARLAMGAVMDGEATAAQLAALLVALRMRGETVEELAGFASAMRERVLRVEAPAGTIDVVGTGGDGSGTFNISTASALVVASTGVPVAKHGNRAITSRSG